MGSICVCLHHKLLMNEEALELLNSHSKVESASPNRHLFLEFGTTEALLSESQGPKITQNCPKASRPVISIVREPTEELPLTQTSPFVARFGQFDISQPLNDHVLVRKLPPVRTFNGGVYDGEWDHKGRRHGRGKEELSDGGSYVGYFSKNKRSWKGRLICLLYTSDAADE